MRTVIAFVIGLFVGCTMSLCASAMAINAKYSRKEKDKDE